MVKRQSALKGRRWRVAEISGAGAAAACEGVLLEEEDDVDARPTPVSTATHAR